MKAVAVKASEAAKRTTLTISVTGLRRFKVRAWLGLKVMMLGAKIVGVGTVNIE